MRRGRRGEESGGRRGGIYQPAPRLLHDENHVPDSWTEEAGYDAKKRPNTFGGGISELKKPI